MKQKNPNSDCLAGMTCPECGNFGPFRIDVAQSGARTVSDNGTGFITGEATWGAAPRCTCLRCGHEATVAEFQGNPRPKAAPPAHPSFDVEGATAFAKQLARCLRANGKTMGHTDILNLLATNTAGYRKWQDLLKALRTPKANPNLLKAGELARDFVEEYREAIQGDEEIDGSDAVEHLVAFCTTVAEALGNPMFESDAEPEFLSEEDLAALGYEINEDPDQPTWWYWRRDVIGSDISFATKAEAIESASRDAFSTFELSRCDNCHKIHSDQTLLEAQDIEERLEYPIGHPNCIEPSGECPDCGALCYLME